MHLTLIIFKLSQDPESSWTDEQNAVHIVHIATYSRINFYAPSFNSFKVIKGSRFLADGLKDGRMANL